MRWAWPARQLSGSVVTARRKGCVLGLDRCPDVTSVGTPALTTSSKEALPLPPALPHPPGAVILENLGLGAQTAWIPVLAGPVMVAGLVSSCVK